MSRLAKNRRVELGLRAVMRMRASAFAAACAVALGARGLRDHPEEDPVQTSSTTRDAIARIERVVSNNSLLDISNQMGNLQAELRSMHNDIDVLNHGLDTSRKQQRDLYADLISGSRRSSRGRAPRLDRRRAVRRRAVRRRPDRGSTVLLAGASSAAAAAGAGMGGHRRAERARRHRDYQAAFGCSRATNTIRQFKRFNLF